jgi:hypothetical protein
MSNVLFESLAQRGNDVTVLSHFPKQIPMKNYHDINMSTKEDDGIHKINMTYIASTSPFVAMRGII